MTRAQVYIICAPVRVQSEFIEFVFRYLVCPVMTYRNILSSGSLAVLERMRTIQ